MCTDMGVAVLGRIKLFRRGTPVMEYVTIDGGRFDRISEYYPLLYVVEIPIGVAFVKQSYLCIRIPPTPLDRLATIEIES